MPKRKSRSLRPLYPLRVRVMAEEVVEEILAADDWRGPKVLRDALQPLVVLWENETEMGLDATALLVRRLLDHFQEAP